MLVAADAAAVFVVDVCISGAPRHLLLACVCKTSTLLSLSFASGVGSGGILRGPMPDERYDRHDDTELAIF